MVWWSRKVCKTFHISSGLQNFFVVDRFCLWHKQLSRALYVSGPVPCTHGVKCSRWVSSWSRIVLGLAATSGLSLPFLNSRHFGRASLRLSHAAGSHRCENTIMWSISSCSVADKNQAWHILWLSVAPGLWPERKTMSCTETHLHNPHQVDHNSGTPLYLQKPPFQDWPTWIHIGLQDHWRYIYHLSAWLHIMNDDLPSSLGISMTKTVFLNPWLGQLTFFLYSNHLTLSYSTMVFYKDEKLESWWRVEAGKVL